MNSNFQKQAGFTLIEMLIVIVVLVILAMIIVPQVTDYSDDTTLRTLQTNLNTLRRAVEIYYIQHCKTYPGAHNINGNPAANTGLAAKAFRQQLFRYSDINGKTSLTKDATYKFGPYLKAKELPINPFNNKNDVKCDFTTTDITVKTSDGSTGWKFYTETGILIANDGAHDDL
ncbi:prepilin-type N-terminal cleavage/methylation domain-containing protein [Thermodesulfobacteriota bacterium]